MWRLYDRGREEMPAPTFYGGLRMSGLKKAQIDEFEEKIRNLEHDKKYLKADLDEAVEILGMFRGHVLVDELLAKLVEGK